MSNTIKTTNSDFEVQKDSSSLKPVPNLHQSSSSSSNYRKPGNYSTNSLENLLIAPSLLNSVRNSVANSTIPIVNNQQKEPKQPKQPPTLGNQLLLYIPNPNQPNPPIPNIPTITIDSLPAINSKNLKNKPTKYFPNQLCSTILGTSSSESDDGMDSVDYDLQFEALHDELAKEQEAKNLNSLKNKKQNLQKDSCSKNTQNPSTESEESEIEFVGEFAKPPKLTEPRKYILVVGSNEPAPNVPTFLYDDLLKQKNILDNTESRIKESKNPILPEANCIELPIVVVPPEYSCASTSSTPTKNPPTQRKLPDPKTMELLAKRKAQSGTISTQEAAELKKKDDESYVNWFWRVFSDDFYKLVEEGKISGNSVVNSIEKSSNNSTISTSTTSAAIVDNKDKDVNAELQKYLQFVRPTAFVLPSVVQNSPISTSPEVVHLDSLPKNSISTTTPSAQTKKSDNKKKNRTKESPTISTQRVRRSLLKTPQAAISTASVTDKKKKESPQKEQLFTPNILRRSTRNSTKININDNINSEPVVKKLRSSRSNH